jgi:hypothetical protein
LVLCDDCDDGTSTTSSSSSIKLIVGIFFDFLPESPFSKPGVFDRDRLRVSMVRASAIAACKRQEFFQRQIDQLLFVFSDIIEVRAISNGLG